jgi:hypothetical protein
VIRGTIVSVAMLAAVVADEGIDILTSNAWLVPVFAGTWIGSNIVGGLIARILPPLRGSLSIWRYRVAFDLEPWAPSRMRTHQVRKDSEPSR